MVDVLDADKNFIYPLQPGDSVHVLAEMNGWVLVETFDYDEPYWGFVRGDDLDTRHPTSMAVSISPERCT